MSQLLTAGASVIRSFRSSIFKVQSKYQIDASGEQPFQLTVATPRGTVVGWSNEYHTVILQVATTLQGETEARSVTATLWIRGVFLPGFDPILPIFAFANAGVNFTGIGIDDLLQPLTLGIAVGLFLGKQIGVFLATWIGVKSGIARLPENVTWRHVYGVACLTGVGFTMSLFIGSLAFGDADEMNAVRLGVVLGSVLSGLFGYVLLKSAAPKPA